MLTDFLKNRTVIAVFTAVITVAGTSLATAYPDIYRAVCVNGVL